MAQIKHYVLTETAADDFREARNWSRSRWGRKMTTQYFDDLHKGANYIAMNHAALRTRNDLTGNTGLGIHAVREHFIVYVPTGPDQIVIVALIRQVRDVPAILRKSAVKIGRQVQDILDTL